MIKKYNLGKLQKNNLIKIDDLSSCPNCSSKDITWIFYVNRLTNLTDESSKLKCNKCRYTDKGGGFEKTNQALNREKKIDQILG